MISWKLPCIPPGKSCHKNTPQGGGELHQALDGLHGCGCQRWSLRACLSITKSASWISSSHHQQTGSFHSHQQTGAGGIQCSERWEWGLSWSEQHVIFRCVSTKRANKMYILLFNSFVIFHAEKVHTLPNYQQSRSLADVTFILAYTAFAAR